MSSRGFHLENQSRAVGAKSSEPQDPYAPQLVPELLAGASARRLAVVFESESVTYGQLSDSARRLAGGLASLGLGPGDPIGVVLPNAPSFVTAFFAISGLGAVVVPLNPQLKAAELEFYFRECGIRAVIAHSESARVARRIVSAWGRPVPIIATGDGPRDAIGFDSLIEGPPADFGPASPDDDCVFQYSSGSSGRPKRVPRTHRQLLAEADSFVRTTGIAASDTILCAIPLFHTYGMGCCLAAAARSGARLVLLEGGQPFSLRRGRALDVLEREQVTVFPAVPFLFRLLAETRAGADLSSLRLCFSAAAALPLSTFQSFKRKFGVSVRQLYGCTETGTITVNLDDDPEATASSVGRPIEEVRLRVLDEAGRSLSSGYIGEIAVSSPATTRGYAGLETLDQRAFSDGYFRTGDRGRVDEQGRLFITGRQKLLIDVKGDKVDPIEVEDVLAVHPKVREVVVVGVAGEVEGEEQIKAVVVPESSCEERELLRFCRERLANYKVPHMVEFRDEIPKSPVGRVLRKYLVE